MPSTDLVRATRLGDLARPPPRWLAALRVAMLAGFLSALGWALAAQWGAVRPLLGQLSVPSLGAALAAVLGGIVATFLCWREVLADLGRRLPLAARSAMWLRHDHPCLSRRRSCTSHLWGQ